MASREAFASRLRPIAGVFAKLRDPEAFNALYVNRYFVTWPGELDLCPDAMHRKIKDCGEWLVE